MPDDDDIESFWEGLRPPPKPFEQQVKEAVETGLRRATEVGFVHELGFEDAQGQAILMNRLGQAARRRAARDVEEARNPFTEVEVSSQLSSIGRAVQQESRVQNLLNRVEQRPADPQDEDLYALSEEDTRAHLEGLRHFLAALGFPARVELSPDTGTLYLTFPPSLTAEIHLGQFIPTASQRPGETTISIER
jgi:hypothetical protein